MRDYSQDLDALLIAKPPRLTVDHLAMYQDYIGKPLHKMTGEALHSKGRSTANEFSLCGGIKLNLAFFYWPQRQAAGWLSKTGRCLTFDQNADGRMNQNPVSGRWVHGDAAVNVVVKTLSDQVDGQLQVKESEPYLASLCGSAVRHTGFNASLAAPHGPTEQEVISTAVYAAGLTGVDIDACEMYGIANTLADPVEVNSLCRVLRLADDDDAPLLLRASKTGIGNAMHSGSAVSLMQAILTSIAGSIGPNLHLVDAKKVPNPLRLRFCQLNIYVRAILDSYYIPFEGTWQSHRFLLGDMVAPTLLSIWPDNTARDIPLDVRVELVFSETVTPGMAANGHFSLVSLGGEGLGSPENEVVEVFSATSSRVLLGSTTLVIELGGLLRHDIFYSVGVAADAVQDEVGNKFSGVPVGIYAFRTVAAKTHKVLGNSESLSLAFIFTVTFACALGFLLMLVGIIALWQRRRPQKILPTQLAEATMEPLSAGSSTVLEPDMSIINKARPISASRRGERGTAPQEAVEVYSYYAFPPPWSAEELACPPSCGPPALMDQESELPTPSSKTVEEHKDRAANRARRRPASATERSKMVIKSLHDSFQSPTAQQRPQRPQSAPSQRPQDMLMRRSLTAAATKASDHAASASGQSREGDVRGSKPPADAVESEEEDEEEDVEANGVEQDELRNLGNVPTKPRRLSVHYRGSAFGDLHNTDPNLRSRQSRISMVAEQGSDLHTWEMMLKKASPISKKPPPEHSPRATRGVPPFHVRSQDSLTSREQTKSRAWNRKSYIWDFKADEEADEKPGTKVEANDQGSVGKRHEALGIRSRSSVLRSTSLQQGSEDRSKTDALIDEKCPILSSPERLRHIIETRELPDAYLHIVRKRFEQHRRFFDKEGRLGERYRPEHVVVQEPEEYPERLVERLVSGFEADGVETEVKPPVFSLEALCREASRHGPKTSQLILCSPEWQNSVLHDEISDGYDTSISLEATRQGIIVHQTL
eukprot:g15454.t1